MADTTNLDKAIAIAKEVVRADESVVPLSFAAFLCGGHILFEDLPGTGKTTLAICMARLLGCEFNRLQFTNDVMPSDVLGTEVFHASQGEFVLRKGPVFTNILLADEVNRATPRAQSALLEAMGEGRISLGGTTMQLPRPFLVIATQNPMDLHGTYPLPESQLDRFFVRLRIGYPARGDEASIILDGGHYDKAREQGRQLSPTEILNLQEVVRRVRVDEKIVRYVLDIAGASRTSGDFRYGLSTRGAIALKQAAQAWAFMDGRDYTTPDDIKAVFGAVAHHRLHPASDVSGDERAAFVANFLRTVPVPL